MSRIGQLTTSPIDTCFVLKIRAVHLSVYRTIELVKSEGAQSIICRCAEVGSASQKALLYGVGAPPPRAVMQTLRPCRLAA